MFKLSILSCLLLINVVYSQPSSCPNLDFETGSLGNWTGSTGVCCPISVSNSGIIFGRHTIMSGSGFDPHSLNDIPVVAPGGGNYSVRLGNDNVNNEAEALQYTMSVTTQSCLFIYRYAVVLEDPSHSPNEQPRFEIRMYDQAGVNIQCGLYNVVSSANIPGFLSNLDIRYKKWTTVGIDLSAYIGQNVTIEFRTGDCALGGHYGYAYIDCACGPLQIQNAFCPNSQDVTLKAPEGFASYLWSTGATTDSIVVSTANIGAVYTVTITSVTGCTVTLSTSIASTSIAAAFAIQNNCQNNVLFADQSSAFNGQPWHWYWDFGDSSTANVQHPMHQYATPGNYTVQLITESDMGCFDTTSAQVPVWPAPSASFTVNNVCEGFPTTFIDSVTIAYGNIATWDWSFGDGTAGQQHSPTHLFASGGGFTAQLIVTSDLGCVDTANVSFTVYPVPVIEAGLDSTFCGAATVNLGDANNPGLIYQWAPANGVNNINSPITVVNIPEPVQSIERYIYYLTGTDATSGCITKDSVSIVARAIPVASFQEPAVQCFNGNSFDLAADPTFNGTAYQWYLGPQAVPGNVFTQIADNIHYTQPGIFPLLLVVDNNGCIDSANGHLRVVEEPVIQMNISKTGCPPLLVDFQSFVTPAGPLQYEWSFTDNTTSTDSAPSHIFTIPGDYGVSLNVTDTDGCSDFMKLTNVIKVLPKPESRFATEPNVASITDPHFTFINLSQNGYMLSWDMGDGTYSTDSNLTHTYQDTGIYYVSLIMQNSFGCLDTSISPLRVEPFFTFYVPNAFTPNGDGFNDSFRGLGMYIRDYEMRIYNRWGRMIYITSDYNSPWDGKGDNDNVAQNEVYEYVITITDTNNKDHQYLGHVSLVR